MLTLKDKKKLTLLKSIPLEITVEEFVKKNKLNLVIDKLSNELTSQPDNLTRIKFLYEIFPVGFGIDYLPKQSEWLKEKLFSKVEPNTRDEWENYNHYLMEIIISKRELGVPADAAIRQSHYKNSGIVFPSWQSEELIEIFENTVRERRGMAGKIQEREKEKIEMLIKEYDERKRPMASRENMRPDFIKMGFESAAYGTEIYLKKRIGIYGLELINVGQELGKYYLYLMNFNPEKFKKENEIIEDENVQGIKNFKKKARFYLLNQIGAFNLPSYTNLSRGSQNKLLANILNIHVDTAKEFINSRQKVTEREKENVDSFLSSLIRSD